MRYRIRKIIENKGFYIGLLMLFFPILIWNICNHYFDSDDYWILAVGREIIELKSIPHFNTLTAIPDLPITVQQWLYDVIIYEVYSVMGRMGILIFVAVNVSLLAIALWRFIGCYEIDRISSIILEALVMILLIPYYCGRPNLSSLVLLIVQMIVQETYVKTGDKKILLWLLFITIVEVNIHASMWLFHILFLLPLFFPAINTPITRMKQRQYNCFEPMSMSIGMCVCAFLNPYGVENVLYVIKSLGNDLKDIGIQEMARPKLLSIQVLTLFVISILYIGRYITQKRSMAPERLYLFWGCFVLATMYDRNECFGIIALLIILCDLLEKKDYTKVHLFINKRYSKLFVILVTCSIIVSSSLIEKGAYHEKDDEFSPILAASYLKNNGIEGIPVYCYYNGSAYMEWQGYQTFIDARAEIYLKNVNGKYDAMKDYIRLITDATVSDFMDFHQRYGYQYYIVENGSNIDLLLKDNRRANLVLESDVGYKMYQFAASSGD